MNGSTIGSLLTDEDRAALYAAIDALPPLTDEECDAVADVLIDIRLKHGGRSAAGVKVS